MMTNTSGLPPIPDSFSLRETSEILDRVKLLLAPTLPGCTLRRFDYPIFDGWSHLELCFADCGPIVPKFVLSPDSYYCITMLYFGYSLFLRDRMNVGFEFPGPDAYCGERHDAGPEAIAAVVRKRLATFDLAAAIAGGTAERIWAKRPMNDFPNELLELSLCGIYLGEYREAQALLQNCLRYAAEDGRALYVKAAAKAEAYLAKLTADPDALRQELIATMDNNWSHFKTVKVGTPS
jgi:hypothetical protein